MNRKTRVNGINHTNTYIVNEITRESRPKSSEERGSKEDYMKMREKSDSVQLWTEFASEFIVNWIGFSVQYESRYPLDRIDR